MKLVKRLVIVALTLTLIGTAIPVQAKEAKVYLNKTEASIYVGNTVTLKVKGTSKKVKWKSSKKKVATVSKKGKVTGEKAGKVTITAKVAKKSYKCKITVKNPGLDKTKLSLEKDASYTLKLNGTKAKSWKSSDKKVATVSSKGKVVAKKAGKATITCKGKNEKTYKCQVTVNKHEHQYVVQKTVPANKEGQGYTVYSCTGCGETYKDNYVDYNPTFQQVYADMVALQDDYPEGMDWTNDNYYAWNGGVFFGGYGCAAFAFTLSDAAFGYLPAHSHTDYSDIKVGDIIRMNNNTHSVIVLEVKDDGVIVAEGNYNSSVHWGRQIPWNAIEATGTYVLTRYPV